jgi:hypothetical protein
MFNIMLKMNDRQKPRKLPIPHPVTELDTSGTATVKAKNVFIYNPYEKKGDKKGADRPQVLFTANELVYFDVTLANPFSFDLDIQSISLR